MKRMCLLSQCPMQLRRAGDKRALCSAAETSAIKAKATTVLAPRKIASLVKKIADAKEDLVDARAALVKGQKDAEDRKNPKEMKELRTDVKVAAAQVVKLTRAKATTVKKAAVAKKQVAKAKAKKAAAQRKTVARKRAAKRKAAAKKAAAKV